MLLFLVATFISGATFIFDATFVLVATFILDTTFTLDTVCAAVLHYLSDENEYGRSSVLVPLL